MKCAFRGNLKQIGQTHMQRKVGRPATLTPEQRKANRQETCRRYRERNREAIREKWREHCAKHPERVAEHKRRYKAKLLSTPEGRLNSRIGAQMRAALGRGGKGGVALPDLVGWSILELKNHLEKQFRKGMTWENMGDWHIDHIIPIAHFMKEGEFDVRAAWALTNLRPLWARENHEKWANRSHLL